METGPDIPVPHYRCIFERLCPALHMLGFNHNRNAGALIPRPVLAGVPDRAVSLFLPWGRSSRGRSSRGHRKRLLLSEVSFLGPPATPPAHLVHPPARPHGSEFKCKAPSGAPPKRHPELEVASEPQAPQLGSPPAIPGPSLPPILVCRGDTTRPWGLRTCLFIRA